jgi:hypothetical protein
MRCPDEDGEGGYKYQTQILTLSAATTEDPSDFQTSR